MQRLRPCLLRRRWRQSCDGSFPWFSPFVSCTFWCPALRLCCLVPPSFDAFLSTSRIMAPCRPPRNAKRLNRFLSPPTVWVERQVERFNQQEYALVEGMILADSGVLVDICGTSADLVRPMCGVFAVTSCIAWFGETCKSWRKKRTAAKLAKTGERCERWVPRPQRYRRLFDSCAWLI